MISANRIQSFVFVCLRMPPTLYSLLVFLARLSARKLHEGRMIAGNNLTDKEDFLSLYLEACLI
jgi:hypothetical protein